MFFTSIPVQDKKNYHARTAVTVDEANPTRDGYQFAGWKVGDSNTILQSGDLISAEYGYDEEKKKPPIYMYLKMCRKEHITFLQRNRDIHWKEIICLKMLSH